MCIILILLPSFTQDIHSLVLSFILDIPTYTTQYYSQIYCSHNITHFYIVDFINRIGRGIAWLQTLER